MNAALSPSPPRSEPVWLLMPAPAVWMSHFLAAATILLALVRLGGALLVASAMVLVPVCA